MQFHLTLAMLVALVASQTFTSRSGNPKEAIFGRDDILASAGDNPERLAGAIPDVSISLGTPKIDPRLAMMRSSAHVRNDPPDGLIARTW